jgi:hypothetical protein
LNISSQSLLSFKVSADTSATIYFGMILHDIHFSYFQNPLFLVFESLIRICWSSFIHQTGVCWPSCCFSYLSPYFLLLYWMGIHCGIYKISYNISNISYFSSPPPPFSFFSSHPLFLE